MQAIVLAFFVLIACSASTDSCSSRNCGASGGDSILLQTSGKTMGNVKASNSAEDSEDADDQEGEEEELGGGGSHWDFLDEEHPSDEDLEHPTEEQHLGGIKDIVKEAVQELVEPISEQVDSVSAKIDEMQAAMESLHGEGDTAQQVMESLEPLQGQLDDIASKVDDAEAARNAMSEKVQSVSESLEALDDLGDVVANAATSDDVISAKDSITGSIEAHEENVAGALGRIYKKSSDNGKVVKKIYKDIHFGAR